jgi:DNA polymerase-3 subunit epsilon/ATP-dependent DNA helicase DinG
MPKTYVALDLETTGLDPNRDAIIEVGALRFSGPQEIEVYSTFVNPGRRIPHFITELTGITDDHVTGAPSIRQVAYELQEFVGRDIVIGHNVGFDLRFLRRHDTLTQNYYIDTFELAGILVPHASRYSLSNLVKEVGLHLPAQTHRALDDARMAHALYVELFERAMKLPKSILDEIVRLAKHAKWPPRFFFQESLRGRVREGFQGGIGAQLAAQRGGDAAGPLFLPEVEFDPLEARLEPHLLEIERLKALLGAEGPLCNIIEGYEYRPEQELMMESVAQAFNTSSHLMVEAGTGTGKSLAYLIPAVGWADQNDDRVVISTNTINLQEQLADKDIPLLSKLFATGFRAMVLKGRSHYLCRRQFQSLRRGGPSNADEMRVLAKILLWLPNTLDGDGDGLFLPTPRERAVWSRLSASAENCSVRDCPYYHGQGCFFYRARERAETAHVLVVNHALLLADIAAENRVLPAYDHLIVDEAHHLESATTEALHFSVDWYALRALLNDLLRGHKKHSGIVDELQGLSGALPREVRNRLCDLLIRLEDVGETANRRLENLFDTLQIFLDEHTGGQNRNYSVRLRITESMRTQPGWDSVELTWDSAATPFYRLVDGVNRLARAVEDLTISEVQEFEAVRARLVAIARRLSETHRQLNALVVEPSDNAIYWLEQRRNGPVAFHTVPLRVGPMVREQLFEKKKTIILTSATLRIAESFDYLRERLEAWEAHEVDVGSPFDYETAALFYVVNDIPEPGQTGYQKAVERALLNLFEATEGRSMALFTSYSQLRATAEAITKPLTKSDITVYAQGGGSSRAQLLQNFREGERAVLLGTRSFWEGVDIPGEALSCLVIAKLPFDVPNDPIIAARAEGYEDAFNEYMVPEAVLRFLQGFGRLIRTKTDRGVVVVLDKRLLTKRYGRRFFDSLPGPTVRSGPVGQLPECAALWLAGEPLPDVGDPYPDDPWGDEFWDVPPEEPPWWD